jgi:glycosyltransferase involved in cell wall biosynthesis
LKNLEIIVNTQEGFEPDAMRRIVLIADVFPPLRSSGAVQLRDLACEFAVQGYDVTVLVASPELDENWRLDLWNGVKIVRLRTPKTKDVSYVRRAIGEFMMPFAMLQNLKRSPLAAEKWDAVVWYSPTIFLGPIAHILKRRSGCPSYLIIRDIFPEWAVDMGIMGRGLPYRFFRAIASYQYSVADVIGVQTPGNLSYFPDGARGRDNTVEVLHNWLGPAAEVGCSIDIDKTALRGRKIFVYAGNMGVAQGMGILIDLAERFKDRTDIGFLFVGRGSDAKRLREDSKSRNLDNVVFFDEIDPDEIAGLYAQCHVGLVALDPRHKTHNIPGKFLSYMQSSLPVLACINAGNDLVELIRVKEVGAVCTNHSASSLAKQAEDLLGKLETDKGIRNRCKSLAVDMFSATATVRQITTSLQLAHERKSIYTRCARVAHIESAAGEQGAAASEYSPKLR